MAINSAVVTISVPGLFQANSKGSIIDQTVELKITVTPNNGLGTEQTVIDDSGSQKRGIITQRSISGFRIEYKIDKLEEKYGTGPWVIKVYRITTDRSQGTQKDEISERAAAIGVARHC